MKKRERLENTLSGATVDRPPVALWRHWQGDDERAADLARAVFAFQEHFDWDFVTVFPSETYQVSQYHLQDNWRDNPQGIRQVTKHAVTKSLNWTELRSHDPGRGDTGKQLECLRLLGNAFNAIETPYIQVVYSPLAQAVRLAGKARVIQHARTHPDRLRSGLSILTENTMRYMEALRRTQIAGIFYVTALADFQHLTAAEYRVVGIPYDMKVLDMIDQERWWLNILHVPGVAPMLSLLDAYPLQILNWEAVDAHPGLARGADGWHGTTCGGLHSERHLLQGSPNTIRDAARQVLYSMSNQHFILSAAAPLYLASPISNIQAVRHAVDRTG